MKTFTYEDHNGVQQSITKTSEFIDFCGKADHYAKILNSATKDKPSAKDHAREFLRHGVAFGETWTIDIKAAVSTRMDYEELKKYCLELGGTQEKIDSFKRTKPSRSAVSFSSRAIKIK
tara:strand:+ start:544 stop:900 length:357 start_codon:yes stop_codon:yes gene_type:complete